MMRIIGAKSAMSKLSLLHRNNIYMKNEMKCIPTAVAAMNNVSVRSRDFSDKKKPAAPTEEAAPVAKSSSSSPKAAATNKTLPSDPYILETIKKNAEFMKTNPFHRTQGPSNTTTVHLTKLDGTVTLLPDGCVERHRLQESRTRAGLQRARERRG